MALEGNTRKPVAKRSKAVRGLNGDGDGGTILAAQGVATPLATAAAAVPDGEAGDNPVVAPVVAPARSQSNREMYRSFASVWITLPSTKWPTSLTSTFARAMASLITMPPNSVGAKSFKLPP